MRLSLVAAVAALTACSAQVDTEPGPADVEASDVRPAPLPPAWSPYRPGEAPALAVACKGDHSEASFGCCLDTGPGPSHGICACNPSYTDCAHQAVCACAVGTRCVSVFLGQSHEPDWVARCE